MTRKKQIERWVEHHLQLYSTQNQVSGATLDAISQLPVSEELDVEPTIEELGKVIECLSIGKVDRFQGLGSKISSNLSRARDQCTDGQSLVDYVQAPD